MSKQVSRTKAREIALHLIFEMSFQPVDTVENLSERLDQEITRSLSEEVALYAGKLSEAQTDYIKTVVKGVSEHQVELDELIEQNAHGWKMSRLSRMTVALLRLALYEMRYVSDVPVGAAINEAVELAKQYDTEEAAGFINGILGSVARADKPAAEQPAEAVEQADE